MPERLYMLAFDHRRSFMETFLRVHGEPTPDEIERARRSKEVIWRGLDRALDDGPIATREAGALVDATYGRGVLARARERGVPVAVPVEASGRREFAFEVPRWRERLEAIDPTWGKVLVRYNPEGDPDLNDRQLRRIAEVSEHCRDKGLGFMLELLVPPEPHQLVAVGGDATRYDQEVRPGLMVRAIEDAQRSGIEPDLWKIEGFDRREGYMAVSAAARADGRDHVGCVVLGRGADRAAVDRWIDAGAAVPGFVGFAIGRTIWWDPLRAFFDRGATDEDAELASGQIAREYRRFVRVFDDAAGR
jgi:myo-inositol catabolism protein IolC